MQEPSLVLIVDDRIDIRLFLREYFHNQGYQALEASSADEAVRIAADEHPSLILMDIMMPERDGLSAVQEIRAHDPAVGIVMMTAYSTDQRAVRAMQVGADDYMHKPFDMAELHTKTHAVLEKQRLRSENRRLQERLQGILQHYMPISVAHQLISAPEPPRLGGEWQEVTLLFADLRGFTAFAAQAAPDDLLYSLNQYLSAATDAVLDEQGTVDKFLGDGVMALFNAPLRDPDHAYHAVRAAIQILARTDEMRPQSTALGALRFGIGIHTGRSIVGNIGAAQLMSYTAIGDPVNVAKRLEEAAKPGQIVVSRDIVQALGSRIDVSLIDPVHVKGHAQPIEVYQVLDLHD